MNTRTLTALFGLFAITCSLTPTARAQGPLPPPVGPPVASMKTLAQIEPRVVIPGGGAYVISQPGSYVLGGNIAVTTGNAITVQSNNVTLDLGGFTLSSTASPASGYGVELAGGSVHITIFNGHIRGTTEYNGTFVSGGFSSGIDFTSEPLNVQVRDVSISGVAAYGIDLALSPSNSVIGCTVRISGGFGIRAGIVSESSATIVGTNGITGNSVSNSIGTLATGSSSLYSVQPTVASIATSVANNTTTVANIAANVATLQTENTQLKNLMVNFAQSSGALPWKITQLAATLSEYGQEGASLAFTPGGQPAMAFRDGPSDRLSYAVFNGSTWQITMVTAAGVSTSEPSLKFTPGGQPAISYRNTNGLNYAVYSGSSWSTTSVETGLAGYHSSLAFTPGGQPAIAHTVYLNTNALLRYVVFNGTSWQLTTVDTLPSSGHGPDPSLKFTPGGQPAIAYTDRTNADLRYAVFNGTTWQLSTVDDYGNTGFYPSLAFSPAGQPAIAYIDQTNNVLRYAVLIGTSWDCRTADSSSGAYPSLAFSPGGQPSIVRTALLTNTVGAVQTRFSTFNGASWQSDAIAFDGSSYFHSIPSLAFTPDGQPAVAYTDSNSKNLRYAVRVPFGTP